MSCILETTRTCFIANILGEMEQLYVREPIIKLTTLLANLGFQMFSIQFAEKESNLLTKKPWSSELAVSNDWHCTGFPQMSVCFLL